MIARLVVPLSVGTAFAAFKYRRESVINDAKHAVTLLNQNINSKAAIDYLEKLNLNGKNAQLCELSTEARLRIALIGSRLCKHTATVSLGETENIAVGLLEDEVKKLKIDDDWKRSVDWLIPHHREPDDASSYKYFMKRRRSQDVLLNRFLIKLVSKTEIGFGRMLIDQNILKLLMQLCNHYYTTDKTIFVNTLKVLANIVVQDQFCADAVAHSEWLPKLAEMVLSNSLEEILLAEKICINGLSVFDQSRKELKTDIYELYRSDDPPIMDVIFLHGIRGSVFRTWREKDRLEKVDRTQCWPRAWLPSDVRVPLRVLGIDYSSSLVSFLGGVETLQTRAERFNLQLKAAGVGDRPVVFICHSMGGLIVKRMLLDDEVIRKNTIGILFMATPHRGSPYAMFAPLGIRPSDDVKLLHQQSEVNRKLHQDFLGIIDSIPVISSVAETEKANLIMRQKGVLVPPSSAYLERGPFYHINDVHHNVCKPSSRDDSVYAVILQFLNDAVCYIKKMDLTS